MARHSIYYRKNSLIGMRDREKIGRRYILCVVKKKRKPDMLLVLVARWNAELEKTVTCKDHPELKIKNYRRHPGWRIGCKCHNWIKLFYEIFWSIRSNTFLKVFPQRSAPERTDQMATNYSAINNWTRT